VFVDILESFLLYELVAVGILWCWKLFYNYIRVFFFYGSKRVLFTIFWIFVFIIFTFKYFSYI